MNWPYLTLELAENASDDDVRAAYQRKVRECPPEKDAQRFSAIQQAYDLVKTAEKRSELKLFGIPEQPAKLTDLVPDETHLRKNIPMDIWLKELNG